MGIEIIPSKYSIEEYGECVKCDRLFERTHGITNCSVCQSSFSANTIIYISFYAQLVSELVKNAKYLLNRNSNVSNNLCDIYDGSMYNVYTKKYANASDDILPLGFNVDGVQVYRSGKKSVWPAMIVQNYLPPNIRYKPENIILVALFYGQKPNMERYLSPLIEQTEKLLAEGIPVVLNNILHTFRPVIAVCSVDLPAKHSLLKINSFNGYNSCTICEHPGRNVRKNTSSVCRYTTYELNSSPIRSADETLEIMANLKSNSTGIKGIKGVSPLTALPTFDIINGMTVDYMHCVCLGVCKKLLSMWLNPSNHKRKFYLDTRSVDVMNKRIAAIKPCSFIHRRPENIKKFDSFKANQLKTLALYYFLPCFQNILPTEYLSHAQLFFSTIYVLLCVEISNEQLEKATNDLTKFVSEFADMYGEENMVMNIHTVLHLVWTVKNWGPLWTQSTFCFENMNGMLTRYVRGTTYPLHQISTKNIISRSFPIMVESNDRQVQNKAVNPVLSHQEIEVFTSNGIDHTLVSFYLYTIGNKKDQYCFVKNCNAFDIFPTNLISKRLCSHKTLGL